MRRVLLLFISAVFMLALMLPSGLLAEDDMSAGARDDNSAAIRGDALADSEGATGGLLESIIDAVADFLDHGTNDPEGPLNDVHPQDWDPPSDEVDPGDDDGWEDHNK